MSNKTVDDLIGTVKKDFSVIQADYPVYTSLIKEHCFHVLLNRTESFDFSDFRFDFFVEGVAI